MKTTGTLPIHRRGKALLAAGVLVALVLMINACSSGGGRPARGSNDQTVTPWSSATPTATPQPSATATPGYLADLRAAQPDLLPPPFRLPPPGWSWMRT